MIKRFWLGLLLLVSAPFAHAYTVEGYIFEHFNFGGESREYSSSDDTMTIMSKITMTLELRNKATGYKHTTTTNNGQFSFDGVGNGIYELTVLNTVDNDDDLDGNLYSIRGNCEPCLPIQTYPEITESWTREVVVNGANNYHADLGFNYSSVLNSNDSGIGTLRQFVVNSTELVGSESWAMAKYQLQQETYPSRTNNRLEAGVDYAIFAGPNINLAIDLDRRIEIDNVSDTRIDATKFEKNITVRSADDTWANWTDAGQVFELKYSSYVSLSGMSLISQGLNNRSDANTIAIEQSNNIQVDNNYISGSFDDAIQVDDSSSITIKNNHIFDIKDDAVQTVSTTQLDIDGNTIYRIEDDALSLRWSNHAQVRNNSFVDIGGVGVDLYTSDQHPITNNSFRNIGLNAIRTEYSGDNLITNNQLDYTYITGAHTKEASAIYLGDEHAHDNDIYDNSITNTGVGNEFDFGAYHPSGVRMIGGNNNYIVNNSFDGNVGLNIDIVKGNAYGIWDENDAKYTNHPNNGIDYPVITEVEESDSGLIIKGFTGKDNKTVDAQRINFYSVTSRNGNEVGQATSLGICNVYEQGEYWRNYEFECHLDNIDSKQISSLAAIAIRHLNPSSTSEFGPSFNWAGNIQFDYGDAPNQDIGTGWGSTEFEVMRESDGARHGIDDNLCLLNSALLGAVGCTFSNDQDDDGQPERLARGDMSSSDPDALDFDDGVRANPILLALSSKQIIQTNYLSGNSENLVSNTLQVTTSGAGYISAWLDINQDGQWRDFDNGRGQTSERLDLNQSYVSGAGTHDLTFSIPSFSVHGESWLRVRFSTQPIDSVSGAAADGEVEDYQVWIAAPTIATGSCEAGIQDPSFEYRSGLSNIDYEYRVPGWNTIPNDPNDGGESGRNAIEVYPHTTYQVPPSPGSAYNSHVAELNANIPGTLYQDVVTTPGQVIRWSFDYIKRPSNLDQRLSLMMGDPEAFSGDTSGLIQLTADATSDWETYSQSYTVPEGQYVTRLAFKADLPASGSYGNLIDNVVFGCETGKDFGDLPEAYEAHHGSEYRIVSPNLFIGTESPDTEDEHQASPTAKADDIEGFNDEYTFTSPVIIVKGETVTIKDISVMNSTGSSVDFVGYLDVLTDSAYHFTGNEVSETLSVPHSNSLQYVTLTWNFSHGQLNKWTPNDSSFLRLALGNGNGDVGEIEDHLVYTLDRDMPPVSGRCDGFVQTKKVKGASNYEYVRWVPKNGQIGPEAINSSLNVKNINAIAINQANGYTYAIGMIDGEPDYQLLFTDQEENAEFLSLGTIVAESDLEIRGKDGNIYSFAKGEVLNSDKLADGESHKDYKLKGPTAGTISLDGSYLYAGRGPWHSMIKVNLVTGAFSTVHYSGIDANNNTPWGPDISFSPNSDGNTIYSLSGNLQFLYSISAQTGAVTSEELTFQLATDPNGKITDLPRNDDSGNISSGGFGIGTGGILFAMTNGGIHDLNQDGVIDSGEASDPTTAFYSVDIAEKVITYHARGEEQATSGNDAGGCVIDADYGDVPSDLEGGNPAYHLGYDRSVKLGEIWTADLAPGNDPLSGADFSDDGVEVNPIGTSLVLKPGVDQLIPGSRYKLTIENPSQSQLSAWISWDGQNWESNQLNVNDFEVPTDASAAYIRVRTSSYAQEILTPFGEATSGEVEDYYFEIGSAVEGIQVIAPSLPLTCEVAEYKVDLLTSIGELSADVNVEVSFTNAPDLCWFDAEKFGRTTLPTQKCKSDTQTILFEAEESLSRSIWVATDHDYQNVTMKARVLDVDTSIEDSDGTEFRKEGFIFGIDIKNGAHDSYRAGETFEISLTPVSADESNPAICETNPDYVGIKPVDFRVKYNGSVVEKSGIHQYTNSAETNSRLLFNETAASVNVDFGDRAKAVLDAYYPEAGSIELFANYVPTGSGDNNLPTDGNSWEQSKTITVTPYALAVDSVSSGSTVNGLGVANFVPAESEFSVELVAVAKHHTENAKKITQNFTGASGEQIEEQVVTPLAHSSVALGSTLTEVEFPTFANGVASVRYKYANVGSIQLGYEVSSYLGVDTSNYLRLPADDAPVIGHFYPDSFDVVGSAFETNLSKTVGNGNDWTYFGQDNVTLDLELNAVGTEGTLLPYYDSGLWLGSSFATEDHLVELTQGMCNGRFANGDDQFALANNGACDLQTLWSGGQFNVDLSGSHFVRDNRISMRSEVLNVQANLIDQSITYRFEGSRETSLTFGETVDIRYGRLNIENASGPVDQFMPMQIAAEYWAGERFEINEWHQNQALNMLGAIDRTSLFPAIDGEVTPELLEDPIDISGSNLSRGQTQWLIGGDAAGYADVLFQLDHAVDWLGYCWRVAELSLDGNTTQSCNSTNPDNYLQSPSGIATFGTSAGSENIIYIRENF